MIRNTENLKRAVHYWKWNHLEYYDFVVLMVIEDTVFHSLFQSLFYKKLNNRKGIILYKKEAKQLLTLYSLYEFSGNIIIGSFDQPYGRKLQNLLSCGIATEEELINDVLLGEM